MNEHVHEWRFGHRSDGNYNLPGASTPGFYCTSKECGYDSGTWLSLEEAEARLNATERLSAEDALGIGAYLHHEQAYGPGYDAIMTYANILEDK